MATDMQALFSGFPSHQAAAVQDARDRQPELHSADPSRNFESVLGRAEARRLPSKHDAPTVRGADRTSPHARQAAQSTSESSGQTSDRSTVGESDDQPLKRSERAGDQSELSPEESEEQSATRQPKQKTQEAVPQEMMLVAMVVPAAQATPVELQTTPKETGKDSCETTINAVASNSNDHAAEGSAQLTTLVTSASGADVSTQGVSAKEPEAATDKGKDTATAKSLTGEQKVQNEAQELSSIAGQLPATDGGPAEGSDSGPAARTDTDHLNSAMTTMTTAKHNAVMEKQPPLDHEDRSTILDGLAQGTSLSEGQAGSGLGRFLEQDGQSLSDSPGGNDRPLPNQTPPVDQNARPAFMERLNDLHHPAPAVSESSFNRSDAGQTTAVLRASESERAGELRGMAPLSQSVTLDLDPLDMGPLRVRVMMSDQTVHAHIRTEHGELGQGLLQQGQSLESSLRTTGLEMGMLRVTIDQQQGRGENAWMFQQQQQQGRPSSPNMSQAAQQEDERGAMGERGGASNQRLSFFA